MNEQQEQCDTLPLSGEPLPLRFDEGGTVRVGNSRVTFDLVVEQYENGITPEDMVRAYDTLELADVHAAIAYYLRHPAEVRAYLARRGDEAALLRARIEGVSPRASKATLMTLRNDAETTDAANRK